MKTTQQKIIDFIGSAAIISGTLYLSTVLALLIMGVIT